MQELNHLQQENASLEIKIKELTTSHNELLQLRKDIQRVQQTNEMNNSKLIQLEEENESLRVRLRSVVQSPLSDAEKQQMIDNSQQRHHSSAPASISMTLPNVSYIFIRQQSVCMIINFDIKFSSLHQIMTWMDRVLQHLIGTNSHQAVKFPLHACKIKLFKWKKRITRQMKSCKQHYKN